NQLKRTEDEGLVRVANTYNKWKIEIANAITVRNENGKRYSNGPAEGLNNAIKTLIKDANGYRNFERFRKRVLLVLGKRKDPLT
ncbi:MAG: transposase, partial [Erysipelotrichaceae bacterium]|nr:transposase [Erysipelotrichaceae bacterium]